MLLSEVITVYPKNYMKHTTNTLCDQSNYLLYRNLS